MGLLGLLWEVGSAQTQGYWKSQLDSELQLKGILSARWILDIEQSRFLFLEQRYPEDRSYRMVGFSSPFFSMGPMDLFGLLREAGSPLEYSLSSTVFREQTGIQLYSGKEVHRRTGFLVAGPNTSLSLGSYREPEGDPHLFATFHLSSTQVTSEGFLSLTNHGEEAIPLEWFPSQNPVLPGPLLHWGSRVRLGMVSSLHGSLTVSVLGSRPSHDRMGVFTHLFGELFSSGMEIRALSGYCTPQYVTPKGERTAKRVQHALGGTLFPFDPFFLSVEGEEHGYQDRRVEHFLLLGAGIRGSGFRLAVQREGKPEKTDWNLESFWRLGEFSGNLAASWEEGDKRKPTSLSIQGSYSAKGWEGELWWKGEWIPRFRVEGRSTLSLKGPDWKIGIQIELLKPLGFRDEDLLRFSLDPLTFIGVSLFFTSYDSHLPIKRISGSRVRP